MKDLINIEKRVIGANETNAVNARELHETLGVKQDFSHWIKKQIKTLGIELNVDYVVFVIKGENLKGGRPQQDYIITTDTAKHISMASRTLKGKEVRNYFISIEKEYQTQNADLNQILPVLQQVVQMMSVILKNQQEQEPKHLSPQQLGKLRGAINLASIPIQEFFEDEPAEVIKAIYSKLNNRLGVPSYIYIPSTAFSEAMELIGELERKYIQKLQERKKMQLEISIDLDAPEF